jgi:DNA repair exonuclease SbcCD ATPase subunit/DNA repair exonuclease SbcCD nuclease subunit
MTYKYIIHLADIHIRTGTETYSRYYEYLTVFENLKKSLLSNKINKDNSIILVAGDIFHNKNKVENFGLNLFKQLINILTNITITVIIPGNHDFLQQFPNDPSLLDSILLTNIQNLHYLNTTTSITLNNIGISTISVKDTLIPGEGSGIIKDLPLFPNIFDKKIKTKIALFHGSFCKTYFNHNQEVDSNNSYPLEMLKDFDIACLGDIHLHQSNIYKNCSYAYSGSLIQQNFGEDIIDHGYLIWNIKTKKSTHIPVFNPYGFVILKHINTVWNIKYKNKLIPINDILNNPNFPTNISIRIDGTYNNIDTLYNILKSYNINIIDFKNIISSTSKNIQSSTLHITDTNYFKLYFNDPNIIHYIDNPLSLLLPSNYIKRNEKISNSIELYQSSLDHSHTTTTTHYTLKLLQFNNCLCYGENNIINFTHFNNKSVIINAPNGFGKSALYEIICYAIYGETIPSRISKKYSASFINFKTTKATTSITFTVNNVDYTIKRTFKRNDNSLKITESILSSSSINISGIKAIQKWLTDNLGTLQDFLKTSMITQDFDYSFLHLDPKNIKKFIDDRINLNSIIKFKDLIKECLNSYKDTQQSIDTKLLELNNNIVQIDFNPITITDKITQLNLYKESLYTHLEYIDYNKYPLDKLQTPIVNNIDITNLKDYNLLINTKKTSSIPNLNQITPYINTDLKKLEEELFNLKNNKPIKPTNYTIIHNYSTLIATHFKDLNTLQYITTNYYPTNTNINNKTVVNNLDQLNSLQTSLNIINDNINSNNILIQQYQTTINKFNNILHSLKTITEPDISLEDAQNAIDYFKLIDIKYPKKYKKYQKYNSQLIELEKQFIKPTISLELCYEYISEYNTLLNLKKTYDIQTEINEIKNILSKYTHIEYNPNCHICIKQPWIIQKLELENKLITLNNQINYSIFNPSKYIKRFNYLKNNLDYYYNTIEQHKINTTITNIKNNKIFTWIQEYNEIKNSLDYYHSSIENHKLFKDYKNKIYELNNNIETTLQLLNDLQFNNNQHNINKKIIQNDLESIYYTINYAHQLYDSYLTEKYNNWQTKVDNIQHILSFKESILDYQNIEDYKQLLLWQEYYYNEDLIKYSKIYHKRTKTLNEIKAIEDEINTLIIYQTNMITHFDNYSKNKKEYDTLYTLQNNINHSIHIFKTILDNYDNFQKWIYNTHVLPNIIKNVNNIITNSTINPFTINAFIENDGIQFSLNNTTSTNKASGFQKFIINIALRISFLDLYNNKSFCSQLFIDEGWTSADSYNRTLIPKVLNYLLTRFNSVILVSHIDEIKDIIDISIKINKNKDHSIIQYS